MPGDDAPPPRHFFLNEAHELGTLSPDGFGRPPNFAPIDWHLKSAGLRRSFDHAASYAARVPDPSVEAHRFVLTVPAALVKRSTSQKALKSGGKVPFTPAFGGEQAQVLGKLGLDLVAVDDAGAATVHIPTARIPQLQARLSALATAGPREQTRWINVGEFREVDWTRRVDQEWLDDLRDGEVIEAHLRFHAVLGRGERNAVLAAIADHLRDGEQLLRSGRDFSGRHWCIAVLRKPTIRMLAEQFPSLQSLHPRLSTPVASTAGRRGPNAPPSQPTARRVDPGSLPIVGLFDTGVPATHPVLRAYVRYRYVDPDLANELAPPEDDDHGSQVASALVFGHQGRDTPPDLDEFPEPTCAVFDMRGGWSRRRAEIPDELATRAIDAVQATSPGVRVFNLSLGGPRLAALRPKDREEKLQFLQDLDNQAFARDVLLVIAAGNSTVGVAPAVPYPSHVDDEAWELGVLASSFNSLVVGAHVDPLAPRGLALRVGAPSPFTLVGPGHHRAPVPSFSAPGGDTTEDYGWAPGSGVWVFDAGGLIKDCAGTSYAAPLVAREAAFAFQELVPYCPDERPFAATVRAWLTLEATRPTFDGALEKLAKRTIGRGFPSAERIRRPSADRAVFVWQTMLESARATARVAVPVPMAWLAQASQPCLRVVVAWLTPVNAALTDSWACRKITAQLRTSDHPSAPTVRAGHGAVGVYPVNDRTYEINLERLDELHIRPVTDTWVLSVSYEELGPPPLGMELAPQQRVGVVMELRDAAERPVSPQAAVRALGLPAMTRLSILQAPVQVPLVVR